MEVKTFINRGLTIRILIHDYEVKKFVNLRTTFTIAKKINEIGSTALVEIYNLASSTQQSIAKLIDENDAKLSVEAGYIGEFENMQISEIFRGTIGHFQGVKKGTETVSSFYAATKLVDLKKETVIDSKEFSAGTPKIDILRWLLQQSETPKTLRVVGSSEFGTVAKQIVLTKTPTEHIREWMRDNKCDFRIESNELVVIRKAEAKGVKKEHLINPYQGMIESPRVSAKGVIVDTVIRPEIKLLDWVVVDTSNAELLRGSPFYVKQDEYVQRTPTKRCQVAAITYEGDTHDDIWRQNIEGLYYYGQ